MAFEKLVCPKCGHGEFSMNCPAIVKVTYEVSAHGEFEISEEILDIDRDGDYTCEDCGEEYGSAQELSTQEAYNESEDE